MLLELSENENLLETMKVLFSGANVSQYSVFSFLFFSKLDDVSCSKFEYFLFSDLSYK